MKITEASSRVVQCKQVAGLFLCQMEHEVKSTKANFDWTGPKIDAEMWQQVLAFFAWSFEKTRSETQVRLFVNVNDKKWAAWAFPQICGTGMTTKEVSDSSPAFDEQRARFGDHLGWIPFGTVHHHCTAGAFQSGTDRDNEHNQDGLHITIGHMTSIKHDMHSRFYLSGCKFEPDMSLLWDIGNAMEEVPEWARALLPAGTENKIAVEQMCVPVKADHPFPQEWKDNLIEEKKPEILHTGGVGLIQNHHQFDQSTYGSYQSRRGPYDTEWDINKAIRTLRELIPHTALSEIWDEIAPLLDDPNLEVVLQVFEKCDVTPRGLIDGLERKIALAEIEAQRKELEGEGGKPTPESDEEIRHYLNGGHFIE